MFKRLLRFVLSICLLSFASPLQPQQKAGSNPIFETKTFKANDEATEAYTPAFTPDEKGNVNITYDDEQHTINVYDELDRQKEYYEDLSLVNSSRRSDIQSLIDKTTDLKHDYQEYITVYKPFNPNKPSTQVAPNDMCAGVIADITVWIAIYVYYNMPLAVELLTTSLLIPEDMTVDSGFIYHPINTEPFYSSADIWNFLRGTKSNGSLDLNIYKSSILNMGEKDLAYSFGRIDIKERTGYKLKITDTYDFGDDNDGDNDNNRTGLPKMLNDIGIFAQSKNILKNYKIEVNLDFSKALMTSLEKQDNGYYVSVKNITSSPVVVSYNSRLCFDNDGLNWRNLSNVDAVRLRSGEETKLRITNNGTADSIALNYVLNGTKYVTVLDQLNLISNPRIRTQQMDSSRGSISDLRFTLLGMSSSSYVVSVENLSSGNYRIKYGYKTMSETNAKNMMNADSTETTLNAGTMNLLYITKSSNGSYAPVNIYDSDKENHIVLRLINAYGGGEIVSALVETTPVYTFVGIWNWGKKDGKWNIQIMNPKPYEIEVSYNAKMCFEDDAKNWKNLSDLKSVKIPQGDYRNVLISTNFFATTIAFSYMSNSKRLVTYADGLTTGGGINTKNNIL